MIVTSVELMRAIAAWPFFSRSLRQGAQRDRPLQDLRIDARTFKRRWSDAGSHGGLQANLIGWPQLGG
jgi:hypothetical protein